MSCMYKRDIKTNIIMVNTKPIFHSKSIATIYPQEPSPMSRTETMWKGKAIKVKQQSGGKKKKNRHAKKEKKSIPISM